MRVLYATSIVPSGRANRMQVWAMARALGKALGENFWLGSCDETLRDYGFASFTFPHGKSRILAWNYLTFARKQNIDFFYCREGRILLWAIIFNFFSRLDMQFVYEVHHLYDRGAVNKLVEFFLSLFVDKYIFVTRHLAHAYAKKYWLKKNQVHIAPDGVDFSIFDIDVSKDVAREKLKLPHDKKIIGYLGRFKTMGDEKGLLEILEALTFLPNDVMFVAMGGKPRHVEEYQEIAREMGLENRALFRGHEVQETVALYQKACDVLLMPFPRTTHYVYYMSPLKMFEYMASRRPIVASDLPSVREVLNELNAALVNPGDAESLVEGIKRVFDNQEFAQSIAHQAYEDAKQYTWERRASNILKHLNS